MNDCIHINYVSIFNSPYGCAYCPDCGKRPLSYTECANSILIPGMKAVAKAIAKDLLTTCPNTDCDMCRELRKNYPDLY